ncbi:hypothetical protein AGMMS49593_09650 [Endomicrobiia bacterium]|nr:hypothetical protein AGMMS49593_09650 [Endomicrobiia bacterium]
MSACPNHYHNINHIEKKEAAKPQEILVKAFPDVVTDVVNTDFTKTADPFYTYCAAHYTARANISADLAAGYANRACTPAALSAAKTSIALANEASNYARLAFLAPTSSDAKALAYQTIIAAIDAHQAALDIQDVYDTVRNPLAKMILKPM